MMLFFFWWSVCKFILPKGVLERIRETQPTFSRTFACSSRAAPTCTLPLFRAGNESTYLGCELSNYAQFQRGSNPLGGQPGCRCVVMRLAHVSFSSRVTQRVQRPKHRRQAFISRQFLPPTNKMLNKVVVYYKERYHSGVP